MNKTMWVVYMVDDSGSHIGAYKFIACYPYKEQAQAHVDQLAEYLQEKDENSINNIKTNKYAPELQFKHANDVCYGIREIGMYLGFDEFQEEHNI